MPVFALPLDPGALSVTNQRSTYLSRRASSASNKDSPSKKRKRDSENAEAGEEQKGEAEPESDPQGVDTTSAENADNGGAKGQAEETLDAALTNPLSLTPDEIAQYRLAGLALDQEIPGKTSEGWPHKGLRASSHDEDIAGKAEEEGEEDGAKQSEGAGTGNSKNPHLRMQHLSALTTILHRNLLEGDMVRAKRAFALLLRAQINGKPISLHNSGYWGIGAEILIRDGEQPPKHLGRKLFMGREDHSSDDEDEDEKLYDEEGSHNESSKEADTPIRWGTAAGLEKAREYYERLILQHPYRDQFRNRTNALDFWPAMIGCEIYGIQYEQLEALRQVDLLEENDDPSLEEDDSDAEKDLDQLSMLQDPEAYYSFQQRQESRRAQRKRNRLWQMRDEIRRSTLVKTEKIAARLDEVMTTPAYADSAVLQRLRGMIALYVGDLSVPAVSPKVEDGDEEDDEGRFLALQRRVEHGRGLERRKLERRRAKKAFAVVRRVGGRVDDLMREVGISDEEAETDDGSYSREESYLDDKMDF